MLFGIAIDWILQKCTLDEHLGIKWLNNSTLSDLDSADDVATLSPSLQKSQRLSDKLCTLADQIGLQINSTKTKIMDLTNSTENIISNGQTLEKVRNFTYLGSNLSKDE
jgi:hypothetical protein